MYLRRMFNREERGTAKAQRWMCLRKPQEVSATEGSKGGEGFSE